MNPLVRIVISLFVLGMADVLNGAEQSLEVSKWVEFLTQRPDQLRSYDERRAFSSRLPALSSASAQATLEQVTALQAKAIKDGIPLDVDFPVLIQLLRKYRAFGDLGPVAGLIDVTLMGSAGESRGSLSTGRDVEVLIEPLSLIVPISEETRVLIHKLTFLSFPEAYQFKGAMWPDASDLNTGIPLVVQLIWVSDDRTLRQQLSTWTQDQSAIFTARFPAQPATGALWDDSTMDQPTLQRSLTCEFLSEAVWLWAAWDPIRDELNRTPPEQRVAARTKYLVKSWLRLRKAPPEYWLATDLEQFKAAGGNEAVLQLIDVVLREVPVVPVDMGDYLGSRSDALYSLMYKLKEYDIAVDAARLTRWKKLAVGD